MLLIPAAFTATFGRMIGRPPPGLGTVRRDARDLRRWHRAHLHRRNARDPRPARCRRKYGPPRRLDGRQHGGQGAALRHRRLGVFCSAGTASRRRRGQQRRGVLHRPRRRRGDGQHDDRGGDLRRPRLGSVRNAPSRRACRVHRGADGRTHARVPRQADPGARDQARLHRRPVRAAARAGVDRYRDRNLSGTRVDVDAEARKDSPRQRTPTCRRPRTTGRRSPATAASSNPSLATSARTGGCSPISPAAG